LKKSATQTMSDEEQEEDSGDDYNFSTDFANSKLNGKLSLSADDDIELDDI